MALPPTGAASLWTPFPSWEPSFRITEGVPPLVIQLHLIKRLCFCISLSSSALQAINKHKLIPQQLPKPLLSPFPLFTRGWGIIQGWSGVTKVTISICGRSGKRSFSWCADSQGLFAVNSPLKSKAYRYVYGSGPYSEQLHCLCGIYLVSRRCFTEIIMPMWFCSCSKKELHSISLNSMWGLHVPSANGILFSSWSLTSL